MKAFCAAFLELHFGFVVFWHKNMGAKDACKMLMELTTYRRKGTFETNGQNCGKHARK